MRSSYAPGLLLPQWVASSVPETWCPLQYLAMVTNLLQCKLEDKSLSCRDSFFHRLLKYLCISGIYSAKVRPRHCLDPFETLVKSEQPGRHLSQWFKVVVHNSWPELHKSQTFVQFKSRNGQSLQRFSRLSFAVLASMHYYLSTIMPGPFRRGERA